MDAIGWARVQRKLRPLDQLVLITLAWYVPPDGTNSCYVGQKRIADDLDRNVGSVRRSCDRLEDAGLVAKVDRRMHPGQRGRGTIVYRLAVDNAVEYRAPGRANEDPNSAHLGAVVPPNSAQTGAEYRAPGRARSGKGVEPLRAGARVREDDAPWTAVDNYRPDDDERERVRALNAAERARRKGTT